MKDPYETLGVAKSATDREIKDAFKKLTRKLHPDLHPGDKSAEERFKAISAAYDLLGDKEKRRRFDAGEIDASGAERPPEQPHGRFYRDYADAPGAGWGRDGWAREGGHAAQDGFASREEFEDFLNRMFGGAAGGQRARAGFAAPGADMSYTLSVSFLDAANGAQRTIMPPDGKGLKVTIPEGAEDGQTLRLRGQGGPGYDGGPPGDAYITLRVEPHAFFHRRDDDIHVELPVTLREAVLGAKVEAPTIAGPVTLTVPKGSNTGAALRLRGRGVRNRRTGERGHQFVTLKVVLPTADEPDLVAFLEGWRPAAPQDPRREMLK